MKRAVSLAKLRQGYVEFKIRAYHSPAAIVGLSEALVELGQIWEAEAWLAYGMTLPGLSEPERKMLTEFRTVVLKQLRVDTPWQLPTKLPSWSWLTDVTSESLVEGLTHSQFATSCTAKSVSVKLDSRPTVPALSNEASKLGLHFFGRTADDLAAPGIMNYLMIGCGGGVIDLDLDGWPDLCLAAAGGMPPNSDSAPNAMFRNLNTRFENVSSKCAAEDRGFSQGIAVGDVNEDGFDDLLVLNYGPNSVWINNGDGTFTDRSAIWLPEDSKWSTSAAIADIDGDGISDAFITNYCAGLSPTLDECFSAGVDEQRSCSPNHLLAENDNVLKGSSGGGFIDVTKQWNAVPDIVGRGLGVVAGAFDATLGVDFYVANDMTANHFWSLRRSDERTLSFEESATIRGLAMDGQSRSQGSMGIAVLDLNRDQIADFYVTNFEDEFNTLYSSLGSVGWTDVTMQEKLVDITMPMVGFGTQAVDFDNNGYCELVVTNGHIDDLQKQVETSSYLQPMQLFQQNVDGLYQSVGSEILCSYFQSKHVGRGLWKTDFNRDGRVDLVVTHQTEPVAILVNQTEASNSHITLRLVGKQDSRNAIGSVVRVRSTESGNESTMFLTSGDGFLCSNERFVHAGLGHDDSGVDITIRWPNGVEQTWVSLAVNQEWLLTQEEEEAFPLGNQFVLEPAISNEGMQP